MSATTREQLGQLSQDAEDLLHETWELFARLKKANEALIRETGEFASKITSLSRQPLGDERPSVNGA